MSLQQAKFIVLIVLLGGLAFACYRAGYKVAESKYEAEKAVAVIKAVEAIKEAALIDEAVIEKREESDKVVTRTITKVQREIIKIPVRDCGFTSDERVSINAAYCISFPDSAACVSNPVPTGPGASASEGRGSTENLGN